MSGSGYDAVVDVDDEVRVAIAQGAMGHGKNKNHSNGRSLMVKLPCFRLLWDSFNAVTPY